MTGADHRVIELGINGITDAVEIGSGGFGVVYRAVEADLGRTVAVKVLSGNLDEAARLRFERERRAMGTLSGHPNIVTIYRGGYTESNNAYLVMEFLARGSLADRLQSEGPLAWAEVLKFGVQLSGALETSHRAGVLHRDIKPGNILLSGLGNAKLCDFGIARLHGAPETQSSVVTASIAHAPPEIINGMRPDAVADIYSLASTMFELVSGSPPFVRPTDESMVPILARIHQDPVPTLPPGQLPAPLVAVLEAAMTKDPTTRPSSAVAFGALLVEAQQQLGQTVTALPFAAPAAGSDTAPPAQIPPFPGTPSQPLPPPGARTGEPVAPLPAPPTTSAGEATGAGGGQLPPVDATQLSGGVAGPPPGVTQVSGSLGSPPEATPPQTAPPEATPPQTADPLESVRRGPAPRDPASPGPDWARFAPVAAISALALVAVAMIAWLVIDDGGDTTQGDTDQQETTTDDGVTGETTTSKPSSTEADGPTTSEGQNEKDYPTYVNVTDASGTIRFNVPIEWSDIERRPGTDDQPFLGAAPALRGSDGMLGSFNGPGVTVTIQDLVTADLDDALDRITEEGCESVARRDIEVPYRGRLEFLANCGGSETQLIHYMFVPPFTNVVAIMRIQIISERDLTAAGTISESLSIGPNS